MNAFIDSFVKTGKNLRKLVSDLEGNLNALEEELPKNFYQGWYEYWGSLEEVSAVSIVEQKEPDLRNARDLAIKLRQHIQSLLNERE
jgi:hypothetical protein